MTKSKQPDAWTRFAIERESVSGKLGTFKAILATGGEASDGHILSIEGMQVPDSMPMLFRHSSTTDIPLLGRITDPRKTGKKTNAKLRVTGVFDLEGDTNDPLLAIRRGFASLVQQASLDAMSVRWDPVFGKFTPRSALPKEHFAFQEMDGENPFGMFFEESIGREGSIVALGADAAALMGRAKDSESVFEEAYWTVLAGRVDSKEVTVEIPSDQRLLFETLTKVVVEAVRTESREAFQTMREHVEELGESLTEIEAKALAEKTSREVAVVEEKEKEKETEPRVLDGAALRSLIHETAAESAGRKIDLALGRIAR